MGFWGGSGIRWTITNNLHLAPDRIHTNTSSLNFYRWDALPGAQPTVSKHWRCHSDKCKLLILILSSCTAHTAVAYYYTAACLFCAPCLSVCSAHWLAPHPPKKPRKLINPDSVWWQHRVARERCIPGCTHWRHLENMTEWSFSCGEADLCQVISSKPVNGTRY